MISNLMMILKSCQRVGETKAAVSANGNDNGHSAGTRLLKFDPFNYLIEIVFKSYPLNTFLFVWFVWYKETITASAGTRLLKFDPLNHLIQFLFQL